MSRAAFDTDLYAVLGVHRAATQAQIKVAYHRLAKAHHPDLRPGDKASEDKFKRVSESYSVLSDAAERRVYDLTHAFAGRNGPMPSRDASGDLGRHAWSSETGYAGTAEERMRRARETRATRARVVYESAHAREDWHDAEEWQRMHYGYGATGVGGMGGGGKAGGSKAKGASSTADFARHQQQSEDARAVQAESQRYRQFAQRFRASRTALDRQLPMFVGIFSGLLLFTYIVSRKLDGG